MPKPHEEQKGCETVHYENAGFNAARRHVDGEHPKDHPHSPSVPFLAVFWSWQVIQSCRQHPVPPVPSQSCDLCLTSREVSGLMLRQRVETVNH